MRRRSSFGLMELIIGVLLIIFGILTFLYPQDAFLGLVMAYGILALVTGIADVVFYVKMEKHMGFAPTIALISGILSVLAGLVLLFYPAAGEWAMLILFPLWFIAHCISRISHLPIVKERAGKGYFYFTLVLNVIGLILGLLMLVIPFFSLFTAGFLVGTYLILLGIDSIVLAISEIGSKW